jgi:PAS domain S-box-containing protein
MKDKDKRKEQLAAELEELRRENDELRKAESERRRAESEMAIFYNAIPDYLTVVDTDYRIVSYNKTVENQFGSDLKGRVCHEVYQARKEICPGCAVKKAIKSGKPEFTYQPATEVGRPVEIYAYPIFDEKGEVTAVLEHGRDVTEKLKLYEERELLSRAVSASGEGIAMADGEDRFVFLNEAFAGICGYSREELLGKTWGDIISPEVMAGKGRLVAEALRDRDAGTISIEMDALRKDGSVFTAEVKATSRWDEAGKYAGCICILSDITERMQAEEELRLFSEAVEVTLDGIQIVDLEGHIIYSNKAIEEMYGYSPEDLKGRHVNDMNVDPEFAGREIIPRIQEAGYWAGELMVRHKGGREFPVWLGASMVKNETGEPIAMIGVMRDITERKRAEEALMESEQRFRGAFENAAVGASMVDLKGRFIKANRRLCEMLGYPEDELLLKTFSDITHPEDVQIGLDNLKRQISGEADYTSFEKRYVRKDGEVIHVIVSPSLIRDSDGSPQYFVGLWQDITGRKLMEERIKASLREKEVLLQEVHHRVKNNMAIISSLLQLQAKRIKDETVRDLLTESRNRIHSLALIHEKLYRSEDFSKIDIEEYVRSLTNSLLASYKIKRGEITLERNIEDISLSIDKLIPCGLIINELVTNSIKHAFRNGDKGVIRVELKAGDSNLATLAVIDNGRGLPEGMDIYGSPTLGLQLVTSLAGQLRGELSYDATGGSSFRIKFKRS